MRSERGFSVVEILVASVAALSILAGVGAASRFQAGFLRRESRSLELRENSRRILESISRELREAGFSPVRGGSFDGAAEGVAVAQRDRVEIRADRHGPSPTDPPDGEIDDASDERIGFSRNASLQSISQAVGQQAQSLTTGVGVRPGGIRFRYFDGCGGELVPDDAGLGPDERARIRRVSVEIELDDPLELSSLAGATAVSLRNRTAERCPE